MRPVLGLIAAGYRDGADRFGRIEINHSQTAICKVAGDREIALRANSDAKREIAGCDFMSDREGHRVERKCLV